MTDTSLLEAPQETTDCDDLNHIICCEDETMGLCGLISLGGEIQESTPEMLCVVCADLYYNTNHCPKYQKCRGET